MFHLLYGGCHARHNPPFELSRPNGLDHFILLLVKTRAEFHIGDTILLSSPDSAVIIRPHTPYSYTSPDSPYADDWIHFTCAPADFPETARIPLNTFIPQENISRFTTFLEQILWEQNYAPEEYRTDNVNALFQVLMRNIALSCQEQGNRMAYNPYRTRLRNLRLSLLAAPYEKYEIKELAEQMGVSISYFQHLYSDIFGISFRADLISMRIEYAKELIQNTNLTMDEIAEQSGYTSEVHFYRQFRKETGFTPAYFRKISR